MNYKTRTLNQKGLVSIAVTMMFLAIITLITVSFAFLMRREQQQVLDRQLSTQAFYAAESGVSDAVSLLNAQPNTDIDNCEDSQTTFSDFTNRTLSDAGPIEYTCVLIDRSPTELSFDEIGTDTSRTIRLQSGAGNFSNVIISWQASNYPDDQDPVFATNQNFNLPTRAFNNSEAGSYKPDRPECVAGIDTVRGSFANSTGMVRAMLIPASGDRDTLIDESKTFFLYPKCGQIVTTDPSEFTANFGSSADNGKLLSGVCEEGGLAASQNLNFCNIQISNVNSSDIYLNLKSIYQASSIKIQVTDGEGNPMPLIGQQAVIDATGKANDVLRRIQVRVPLRQTHDQFAPEFVLESMDDICKRLQTRPGSTSYGGCTNPAAP